VAGFYGAKLAGFSGAIDSADRHAGAAQNGAAGETGSPAAA
jgi:hypothetical protein